jgi:uncharacterized protein YjiS (DUF1127 family)
MTNSIVRFFENAARRRVLREELESLDERQLSDLGISRADFSRIIKDSF